MSSEKFDRNRLKIKKLVDRKNKIFIERDHVPVMQKPVEFSEYGNMVIQKCVEKIKAARNKDRSVILTFGAHTIKNGMAPTLIALMKEGWVTHFATNGAGIIHDWEFAYQGKTSEDVRENVDLGQFGIWDETGFYINLALLVGAYEGLGYGESIGKMIFNESLFIPEASQLYNTATQLMKSDPEKSSAAIDLAGIIQKYEIKPGLISISHPFKKFSVQSSAFEHKIKFTGHPMFGHDIIYTHPINHGASVGRAALTDFLLFAESINNIDFGVYMSIGSAVMSPMIFEKSFSMAQNIHIQANKHIDEHYILVVDLEESEWDWEKNGEPPKDNPAYYLRFYKTFYRMGGEVQYLTADNRDFLLALHHELIK